MSQFDDFDIIDEENPQVREQENRSWLWILIALFVAIFIIVVGIAYMTIANRLTPTDDAQVNVIAPTETPAVDTSVVAEDAGEAPAPTEAPAEEPSPTVTVEPTPAATATAQVACAVTIAPEFAQYEDRERMGCAIDSLNIAWSAWETFEGGNMLWRSDTDITYVFVNRSVWFPVQERWDGKPITNRGTPPAGLLAPERGFGYVWGVSDDIYQMLGWATSTEKGFCAMVQNFEQGFILQSVAIDSCTPENLYNHANAGDWAPVLLVAKREAQWQDSQTTAPRPQLASGTIPPSTQTRPANHGLFYASRVPARTLDSEFSDWPSRWTPISTVVHGPAERVDAGDLSAEFQTAWSDQGLYLAIRVTDDVYRSGPDGTNMWQGDGLELHLDRNLDGDFGNPTVDADDYQLGISFGANLSQLNGYRWLPFAEETAFTMPGYVAGTNQGYEAELLLPWSIFGLHTVDPGQIQQFGFNISVNDNDSDTFAQQTVISASPQRTTHDNPTEWATLILQP